MTSPLITFNDFPDEVLLMIFGNLPNIDVLYSSFGVNQRLTRLVRDPIFIRHLTFPELCDKDPHHRFISNAMLKRMCSQILPSISNEIVQLDLDSSSIKDIFYATRYSNLSHLSLENLTEESVRSLFTDGNLSTDIFQNQIRILQVTTMAKEETHVDQIISSLRYICEQILVNFHVLDTLSFNVSSSSIHSVGITFDDLRPNDRFYSSTLVKLNITLDRFEDLLYFLDGRFSELEIVDVNISYLRRSTLVLNEGDLPRLKSFSICTENITPDFEETILPLLCRMSNLESLHLCLRVYLPSTFIDEFYLMRHLPCVLRLKQFRFFIHSSLFLSGGHSNLPIMKNIEQIAFRSANQSIISYGDYFPTKKKAQYILYSSPCYGDFFSGITNRFPGGRFDHVRRISLRDEKPFEHEFFLRLEQSFPSMEELTIANATGQHRRKAEQSLDDPQNLSPIRYRRLQSIALVKAHDDYLVQFLFHLKANLNRQLTLYLAYQSLQSLANNFTSNQIRINANQVTKLYVSAKDQCIDLCQKYFPHAQIFDKPHLKY